MRVVTTMGGGVLGCLLLLSAGAGAAQSDPVFSPQPGTGNATISGAGLAALMSGLQYDIKICQPRCSLTLKKTDGSLLAAGQIDANGRILGNAPGFTDGELAGGVILVNKGATTYKVPLDRGDRAVNDPATYDTTPSGQIALAQVDETPSRMAHTMEVDGKTLTFAASAGHLVAYGLQDPKRPGVKDPKAAIFYTAYTLEGVEKSQRPVTFFWNGGPGSASIWLHMGSWAPKRLVSNAPEIKDYKTRPESFPYIDDKETLLRHSDLVFVDPPGTGYSTAVAPYRNRDVQGADPDAQVVTDFIIRYINATNRQASPKYLYGESYGGIRTPIVANLLEEEGTSRYAPDPSGKAAVVLTGVVLQSPILDYGSECNPTCGGIIPTFAMVADYHKKSTSRGTATQAQYLQTLREFVKKKYDPVALMTQEDRDAYLKTPAGQILLKDLSKKTGLSISTWSKNFNSVGEYTIEYDLLSGFVLDGYDGRMKVPSSNSWDAGSYIDVAFENQFKTHLLHYINYSNASYYQSCCYVDWGEYTHNGRTMESLGDIQGALTYNPALKWLVLHGYEDLRTPGYQTELDLAGVKLLDRVPVKWFEGGHMTYNTEASREGQKQELDKFYTDPLYSLPLANPSIIAKAGGALQPAAR